MVALLAPGIDPTLAGPATAYVSGGGMLTIDPPEVTPGPGDPDTEYEPVPSAEGPRIELEIGRAVTREPVGFLATAAVEDWCDDVELLAGYAATATASTFDPLWAVLAESTVLGADGRLKYEWDPRGYMAWVYRDGQPAGTYIFMSPVDIGDGRYALPMVGPQEQWASQILGRGEQADLLADRGSFEDYTSIAEMEADGWVFGAGVTPELVADGVRGLQALKVTGDGWVQTPKVTSDGADGYSRVLDGAVFGNWHSSVAAGTIVALAKTSIGGTSYDLPYALTNAGTNPDGHGWTEDPVTFAARMAPVATAQRCWAELRSFPSHASMYDLAQLRLSVQTGFPPGTDRDLSYYIERIHRDAVSLELGGHPDGLRTRVQSLTGTEASLRWAHANRTPVAEVYRSVLEMEGGPECRITAGWWLDIYGRLGTTRDDVTLSMGDILNPGWTTDPGARVDRYMVDTGRGSGVSALFATIIQPSDVTRFRIDASVQGPTDRTLNQVDSWATAHARVAARQQVTCTVSVPWLVADQIVTGDVVWVAMADGDSGFERQMRVLRRRYVVDTLTCEVTLGAVDA